MSSIAALYHRPKVPPFSGRLLFFLDPSDPLAITKDASNYVSKIYSKDKGLKKGTGGEMLGNHLTQSTPANQPLLIDYVTNVGVTLAGKKALSFDGMDDYMKSAEISAVTQPNTSYIIMRQVSWTSGRVTSDGYATGATITQSGKSPQFVISNGRNPAYIHGAEVGKYVLLVIVDNGADSMAQVGGLAAVSGDFGSNSRQGLTIGAKADGTLPANIDIALRLTYYGAHTPAQQNTVKKWIYDYLSTGKDKTNLYLQTSDGNVFKTSGGETLKTGD